MVVQTEKSREAKLELDTKVRAGLTETEINNSRQVIKGV